MARQGKFARLPHALREEINRRLLDGETSGVILAWLNAKPEAIRIWDAHFDGAPATPQNLSEWRLGGYKDWIAERESIENTKALASYAAEIAGAGGALSSGLQAILAGRIMESFEVLLNADEGDEQPDKPVDRIAKLSSSIVAMRNADTAADRVALDKEKVSAKKEDQKLSREKFEMQTVAKYMQFSKSPEAQAILNSNAKKDVKMEQIRKLMFG
jgi:hypothetical protein